MGSWSRHKKILAGALALLTLVSFRPARDTVRTAQLLGYLGAAAQKEVSATGILRCSTLRAKHPGGERRAVLYQPPGRVPEVGILLLPGLTQLGSDHPRFVQLARALARLGYVVLTPDLAGFRQFKLEEATLEEISFWYRFMKDQSSAEKVGIVGISVAGTFALMSAALPDIRQGIAFVVCVGGYQNLARCARYWFSSETTEQQHGDYPVHYYGKWICMLAALDLLPEESERLAIENILHQLLATGDCPAAAKPYLSEEAQRWHRLAISKDPSVEPQLTKRIQARLADLFDTLSPDGIVSQVRCPVFLVHGSGDELIPSGETAELERRLTETEAHVLLTPLISHTHPRQNLLSGYEKWAGYWEAARFLYAFVGTGR